MSDLEEWQSEKESRLAKFAGLDQQQDEYDESEEEVMALVDSDTNWGKSRSNYYGGADDQGDESAQEDEEEEALKLQERMAQEMDEEDFFDEDDAEGWKKDADEAIVEELQVVQDPSLLDNEARLDLLKESYPEVLLLAKELEKCKTAQEELQEAPESEATEIKQTALNSYMAMIYSYYALFTKQVRDGSIDLKEHPVMEGILKARELWRVAKRLGDDSLEDSESEAELAEEASGQEFDDIALGEDGELVDGASEEVDSDMINSDAAGESEQVDSDESDSADEFSIAAPKATKTKKRSVLDDFNEAADTVEQQARAKSKQSLRFYTSAIDKRNAPKVDKFAGDLDLPYKERAFERRKRLQEEARLRGLETKDKLGAAQSDDENFEEASNEVYQAAKSASLGKKRARQEMHEASVEAAKNERNERFMAENSEAGDKRAVSYQILKNRGLTPKRAKINRNSRLKKRVRYEEAKKKLRGVRKEFKGQTGAYTGESTGIRKNVVHSVKF